MIIDDVQVLNWRPDGDPPGSAWWHAREQAPDEPGAIVALMVMRLSQREYQELCDRDRAARSRVLKAGDRWLEVTTGRTVVIVGSDKPWWRYEDELKLRCCCVEDFFVRHRFRRLP